jgi:ATP-dependent Clp protease ATP-binding subunit ClpB
LEQESRPEKIEKCYRDLMLMRIEEKALEKESDAASQKRLAKLKKKLHVRQKELDTLETQWKTERAELDKMKDHKLQLASAKLQLETAEKTGDLGRASELKYSIIPELEASEENFDHKIRLLSESVTEDSILRVVSKRTGIDVERMSRDDRARLSQMEEFLGEKVVGQPEAIEAVSSCIKIARTGLQNPNKPLGVFFFVGPTGVGKTELCKALAQQMFDSEKNIVRLDMQDYSEKHSTSKLIGAPPGYIVSQESILFINFSLINLFF